MPEYRTYKGEYIITKPEKYIGDKNPIYRSSWEALFFRWCEDNKNVIRWCSEGIKISYHWPDGTMHKYIPDGYIEIIDKTNSLRKFIVEIKPIGKGPVADQNGIIHEPKKPLKKSVKAIKRYLSEMLNYQKNTNKWKAAQQYCIKHNMQFIVLTDHDFIS